MKCSVCAQDVPEDSYSEHLETEHGVTDDPTAVLIQHLSGLGSRGDEDGDDALPDEEPSDADAFEEFLVSHPTAEAEEEESEADEDEEEKPEPKRGRKAAKAAAAAGAGAAAAGAGDDVATAEGAGEELTDEDEAEFERMLATYPEVDLRKGKPKEPAEDVTEPTAAVADGD